MIVCHVYNYNDGINNDNDINHAKISNKRFVCKYIVLELRRN